jgi:hypothetical protein
VSYVEQPAGDDRTVAVATVCRADPIGPTLPQTAATIRVTERLADHLPAWVDRDPDGSMAAVKAFFRAQAEDIHRALSAALPGGTLDALFAVMAADRASVFRVPRHDPTPAPEPKAPCPCPDEHAKLSALTQAGVDNWQGYDYAMDILREMRGQS